MKGTVKLVFQPGEESHAGAYHMLREGKLDDIEAIFALHVRPTLATGQIASRAGPLLAASGLFEAIIKGKGGHAAAPHIAIDPLIPASFAILSLQQLVSRETDPLDSRVTQVSEIEIFFHIVLFNNCCSFHNPSFWYYSVYSVNDTSFYHRWYR